MVITDESTKLPTDPVGRFEDFLHYFELNKGQFPYNDAIKQLDINHKMNGERALQVDFDHLIRHSSSEDPLANDLLENPEWLKKFDQALANRMHDLSPGDNKLTDTWFVRLYNLPQDHKVKLSKISAEQHVGKLNFFNVTICGTEPLRNESKIAHFECKVCGATHDVDQVINEPLAYPAICNVGGCKNVKREDYRWLDTSADIRDVRILRVQENADESDPAKDPDIKEVEVRNELARMDLHVGDRVRVVGIVRGRILKTRVKENTRILFIEGFNIIRDVKPLEELEITQEEENKIKELAKRPDVMDLLIRSLAPDVFGLEEVKKAMILAMFKGIKLKNSMNRAEIHIAVIGDPGTAKTRLAFAIMARVPLSAFASGEKITAAGLTGTTEQVKVGGTSVGWRFTIGKIQMAVNGLLIMDEFDKSDPSVPSALNQVMETGRLLSDKASVHVDSYCPVGLIMLANPKLKVWSDDLTFSENVRFGLDFLSRFDLVFIVRTPEDSKINEGIADTKLNQYPSENGMIVQEQAAMEDVLSPMLFKKWIKLSSEIDEICIAEDAKAKIKASFLKYTSVKNNKDECLPITTRNLDQIIRLASARAKISLRSLVNVSDVEFALAEIDASLKSCGWGKDKTFDVDQVQFGQSSKESDQVGKLVKIIKNLYFEGKKEPVDVKDVVERARFAPLNLCEEDVNKLIDKAKSFAFIVTKKNGKIIPIQEAK